MEESGLCGEVAVMERWGFNMAVLCFQGCNIGVFKKNCGILVKSRVSAPPLKQCSTCALHLSVVYVHIIMFVEVSHSTSTMRS